MISFAARLNAIAERQERLSNTLALLAILGLGIVLPGAEWSGAVDESSLHQSPQAVPVAGSQPRDSVEGAATPRHREPGERMELPPLTEI
ncbi:MAG TPA: hypothetical protein VEH54_07440 [Steroidobacteraceae bacterium]|nr:hypothetical protein [Steroidobacteraceae bacterium]